MTSMTSQLEELFLGRLSIEDDPAFWTMALGTMLRDVEALDLCGRKQDDDVVLQIGACSHWSHPHWVRWKAAGGFASPDGYQGAGVFGFGLPEFDWYILLQCDTQSGVWIAAERFAAKRARVLRAARPTRTRKHNQAVVSAIWKSGSPARPGGKRERRYGFRKRSGVWRCVAAEEFPRDASSGKR